MPRFSYALSRPPTAPKYRRHRPTGEAVVTLDGRDIYLKWAVAEELLGPSVYQRLAAEVMRKIG